MPQSFSPLAYSRHLARVVLAHPEWQAELAAPEPLDAATLDAWLAAAPPDENTLKPALRQIKQRALLRIGGRDLDGRADLAEVVASMSCLAEMTVLTALRFCEATLVARYGVPRNAHGERQQLIVIGMGKLGGRELNVSSDIDLIFVYPEDGDTDGSRPISNFEFFTRLGRQLIAAIGEITGDGQVFRVDMRLRPNGDSGPLVASFAMLENYFVVQGREWERYAWIKARPLVAAADATALQPVLDQLEAIRRPFVFRKYLDFGTIDAMRGLHAQIRREVAKKDMADNIKLGPGGIREIEFIAQVFQLIRGGRDAALQLRPTLAVLDLLATRGQLSGDAVAELTAAYRFLRRLEHRLQYLDDAQTQMLPGTPEDQARVAAAMGCASYAALLAELDDHRATVARHFAAVFADPTAPNHQLEEVWSLPDCPAETLLKLGFGDTTALCERLAAIRAGSHYRHLSDQAKGRFDALVPRLIEAAAPMIHPDATLARLLDLLEAIGQRSAYLALLLQYPQALAQVARIVGASSWAAEYLQHHPILLDELIDPRLLEMTPDWAAFRGELAAQSDALEPDTERQMDLLREAHHAQVFRLASQDVAGLLSVEKLSDHLSELADILVDRAVTLAWRKLPSRHRDVPAFAVIGYGKLGGKELGYASDLDLVYLYDDPAPDAAQVYAKLGTRLNTWLSSRTPAGILFETDLRLRPNGDAGLVACPLAGFRQYQFENAWVWEHQALTRARFVAGNAALGAAFEKIRCEILCQQRESAKLRAEVLAMRQKMFDNLTTRGNDEVFDLKQDFGGLVDVEFIVQYLILAHACKHHRLTGNLGNIALLKIAAECGLIPADLAQVAGDAYRSYRREQHLRRLNNLDSRVAAAPHAERIAAVRALWKHVFGD